MAVFIAASGAAILLLLLLVFFNAPPQGTASDGHDPVALPGRSIPPRTNIPNAVPSQRLDAQPIRDVRIVRLSVLPNQPHHEIICGEIRLYDAEGAWIAPVAGYVRSARKSGEGDWRLLSDDNPRSFVHTDATERTGYSESEAPNIAELHYAAGTHAARVVVWSRPDVLVTTADRMTNVELSVVTPIGSPFRRALTEAMATPYNATQRYYDFDLRV